MARQRRTSVLQEAIDNLDWAAIEKQAQEIVAATPQPRGYGHTWAEKLEMGKRIRKLRRKMKLSVRDFSAIFPVSPTHTARWESGRQHPLPVHIRMIEQLEREAFGMDQASKQSPQTPSPIKYWSKPPRCSRHNVFLVWKTDKGFWQCPTEDKNCDARFYPGPDAKM